MRFLIQVLLLFLVVSTSVFAEHRAVAVDYLQGEGDVKGIKLAYQYHLDNPVEMLENFELYFESSVNFWQYGKPKKYDTNFVLAISPVLLYPIGSISGKDVKLELGIGVSLLDDTKFAGKDVSTHYQFEDRIGLVTYFGDNNESSLSLRYLHYSNAGFKSPNPLGWILCHFHMFVIKRACKLLKVT